MRSEHHPSGQWMQGHPGVPASPIRESRHECIFNHPLRYGHARGLERSCGLPRHRRCAETPCWPRGPFRLVSSSSSKPSNTMNTSPILASTLQSKSRMKCRSCPSSLTLPGRDVLGSIDVRDGFASSAWKSNDLSHASKSPCSVSHVPEPSIVC